MAITSAICNSFKQECLQGVHVFGAAGDTFKLALIKAGAVASFGKANTNYSDLGSDEHAAAGGYSAGGVDMVKANCVIALTGDVANVDWTADPAWGPNATISAIGAMLYNSSKAGKAVAVFDFGGTYTCTNGTLTITLPAAGATASVRIS